MGAAHMHQPGLARSPPVGMTSSKRAEADGNDSSTNSAAVSTATSRGGRASAPGEDVSSLDSRHQTSSQLSERSAATNPIPNSDLPQASAKPAGPEKLPQSVPGAVPPAKSSTTADLPHHKPSQAYGTDAHEQRFREDIKNLCLEGAWHNVVTFLLRDDLMQFTFTTMDSPLHLALLATRSDPLIWLHVEAIVNARPDLAHVYSHDEATCLRIASAEYQIQPPKREDQLALFLAVSPSLNRVTLSSEQIVIRSRAINAIMAANQAALAMTDAEARSPFHLSLFTPGFLFGVSQRLFAAFPGAACSPDYLGHYPLHTLCKCNEPIPAMLLSVLIDAYPGATSVRVTEDGSDDKCHTPGTFLVQNEVNKGCLKVLMDKINMYVASPAFTDVMVASQRKSESARLIWQASTSPKQAESPGKISQRPPTDEVEGGGIPSPGVAEDIEAREREEELNEEKKVAHKEPKKKKKKKKKKLLRQSDREQERLRRLKHELRKKQRVEELRKKREDMERHYADLKERATAQLNALRDIGISIEKAVKYAEMDPSSAEWKAAKKENADIVKQGQNAMRENIRLKGLLLAKQTKNKRRLEETKLQEEELVRAKRTECDTQLQERKDKCIEELSLLYEEAEKKASDFRKQALRDAVLEAEGLEKEKAAFLEAEAKERESRDELAKMRSDRENKLRAVRAEHEAIMARDRNAYRKKMNELLSQIEMKRKEAIVGQEERRSKNEDSSYQGSQWGSNDDIINEPPIEGQVGENGAHGEAEEAVNVIFELREDIAHCEGVIDHLLSRKRKRDNVTPHSEDDYVDVVGLDDDDAANANELFGITERGP